MLDSIQIKKRLAGRGFTEDQAEGLAEELAALTESDLVTSKELDRKFARWALRIVLANAAVTAALLALYGFAA